MKKKGEILVENVIFIILNLIFFSILILFLYSKMSDTSLLEEYYSKRIALTLDSAKPGMEISFNLEKILDKVDKSYSGKIVDIQDNVVKVRIDEKSQGYTYCFFNNIRLNKSYYYPESNKNFVFKVEEHK